MERAQKQLLSLDPASASVVAALEDDPFYVSICGGHLNDPVRRRETLAQYFSYSIQEGRDIGRCVRPPDAASGVAVWLLPQSEEVRTEAAREKRSFLESALDSQGRANYYRIVEFMNGKAATFVGSDSWYLSIVAIDPALQGQGLGRKLLEPTIAEADRAAATCYVETFSARNVSFYERLGFVTQARFSEPTTGAQYAVMVHRPMA